MWKILFTYSDQSKLTLTGKKKDISLRLAIKYYKEYGLNAESSIYQRYPKKEYEPISLIDKIMLLQAERERCDIIDAACPYDYSCSICRLHNDYEAALEKARELADEMERSKG